MTIKLSVLTCNWCQKRVLPEHRVALIDKLTLHEDPQKPDTKSCVQHYRDYCKYIKNKT